ncbi:MAG: hypothetical protein NTU49_01945 [Gammaproteobacteria bacterium]|nr:hypothetical protein [Gammaproteobacteria bacterium]
MREGKSLLVKTLKKPAQTPNIYGEMPSIIEIKKQKKVKPNRTNSATTPYHLKTHWKNPNSKQPLAGIEAATAHFSRLVFSSKFTPKVRVVAETPHDTRPCVISKTIPNFKPAQNLSKGALEILVKTQKRELAQLAVKFFLFKDPDMHSNNWGLDQDGNVVNIDHDRAFYDFAKPLRDSETNLEQETAAYFLLSFPNLIYKMQDIFNIISSDDINNLPFPTDAKPHNHPFKFSIRPGREEAEPLFAPLTTDPEFIKWKFYYFTKYLLLMTPEKIKTIIKSHSIAPDSFDEKFSADIIDRQQRIKNTLFQMPDYNSFLKNVLDSLINELASEAANYNLEFQNNEGVLKAEKKDLVINFETLKDDFKKFVDACSCFQKTNTPEKIVQKALNLEISRIKMELPTIQTLEKATAAERSRYSELMRLSLKLSFSQKLYTLRERDEAFISMYYSMNFKKTYLKKNPNATVSQFLSSLAQTSKENVNYFESQQKNKIALLDKKIKLLFETQGSILSKEQLEEIWIAFHDKPSDDKIRILMYFTEFNQFEKIPELALQWLTKSTEHVRTSTINYSQHLGFQKLYQLCEKLNYRSNHFTQTLFFHPSIRANAPGINSEKTVMHLLQNPGHHLFVSKNEFQALIEDLKISFSQEIDISQISQHLSEAAGNFPHDQYHLKLSCENNQFKLTCEPAAPSAVSRQTLFNTHIVIARPRPKTPEHIKEIRSCLRSLRVDPLANPPEYKPKVPQ